MALTTNTTKTNDSNFAVKNTEHSYLQLGENKTKTYKFDEPDGSGEFTLELGTLVAVVSSSGKIVKHDASATDGSQFPVGFVTRDVTMAQGATDVDVLVVIAGRVNKSLIKLNGQNLSDPIQNPTDYNRNIAEAIEGDTYGIELVDEDQLDAFDNS